MKNLNTQRLVEAACLLSEICWDEEPSMRANLAFEKINALPIYSLSHPERLWISITLFHRYNGVKSIIEQPFSAEFILTKQQLFVLTVKEDESNSYLPLRHRPQPW